MAAIFEILRSLLPALLPYALPVLTSLLVVFLTYQTYFHPLSKYPGPVLARYTNAYTGYYAHKQCVHLVARQNHLHYGPVVRLGPNRLVFGSVAALRDIYKNDRLTKPSSYMALSPGLRAANVFTASDKQFHRTRRRLIGRILTEKSLGTFEPKMAGQMDIFLRNLLASTTQGPNPGPVNMTDRARRLTINVAGLLGFGYDLGLQTNDKNDFMLTVFDVATPRSSLFYHFYAIRPWIRWLSIMFFLSIRERFLALMDTLVTSRMKQDKDAIHDLYSVVADVLDTDTESGSLRQSDLWAEAFFFLTAAGETSKTAMAALFFYLSRDRERYDKLAHEIRSSFSSGKDINATALTDLRYLRACVDEALRLAPPAAGILWRERGTGDDSQEPLLVDGVPIPRGTTVGLSLYALHHDEQCFPDSFTFSPERWLQPATSEQARLAKDAFAPFSVGSRACGGKSMAYTEITLIIAKTLWYFDFEAASGRLGEIGAGGPGLGLGRERPGEFQIYDIFNSLHDGPYLDFKPRGDLYKELIDA